MKKIIINNNVILFLNISDFTTITKNDLLKIKNEYENEYDKCFIYNYYDLKNNKLKIKDQINKIKHYNQTTVHARKCRIRLVDNNIKNEFLNNHHIQGTDKSQIFYGAYYDETLISIITFNTSNKFISGLNENDYELSRFAVKSNLIINGIFNKLLKRFIDDYKPSKIVSFADLNTSNKNNNIYIKSGFKLNKIIRPDYKYYSEIDDKIYHKFTFGTKYDKNVSVGDIHEMNRKKNLIKVWNCGKLKYELFINENNEKVFGFIYQIKNVINNKKYIGQTTRNIQKRIYEYKSAFNLKNHNNPHLFNSFNKYGWDNFEFSVIDSAQTMEELNSKEIKYIIKYDTTNKNLGYNIESGGNNAIPNIETRQKMLESHSGIKQTQNWINKRVAKAGSDEAKKYGRAKTEEEKQELSLKSPKYWEGKTRTEETKRKISETKKQNGLSDKQKLKLQKTVYAKTLDGNFTKTYESTKHASLIENVNQSTISRWCSNNKVVNNFMWSY
jgi:group I intron endonuclease